MIGGALLAVAVVSSAAISVKRLHDVGLSGWWVIPLLLPYVSAVGGVALLLWPGDSTTNAFDATSRSRPARRRGAAHA